MIVIECATIVLSMTTIETTGQLDEDTNPEARPIERGSKLPVVYDFHRSADERPRLGPLSLVREDYPIQSKYALSELEKVENSPHPYAPTLGIEIEVYDSRLLTKRQRTAPEPEKAKAIEEIRILQEKTAYYGFPRDMSDPNYWEFALRPSSSPKVIVEEVSALDQIGLLKLESQFYPLHITIGGVDPTEGHGGGEVLLLARALDASGWACSSHRLRMPKESGTDSWGSDESGVYTRDPGEAEADPQGGAVEVRTQAVKGIENLATVLEATYCMAACLSAYKDIYPTPEADDLADAKPKPGTLSGPLPDHVIHIRSGSSEQEAQQLADIWGGFSSRVSDIFQTYGLPLPASYWQEPDSGSRFGILRKSHMGDFGGLADMLAEYEAGTDRGVSFVTAIRDEIAGLVAQTKSVMGDKYAGR